MYKFMLIILPLVVVIFSSSCAPYPVVATTPVNKISEKVGLPFGTVITLGGKKMVVISQENEEVRLQPFNPVIVKAVIPKVKVTQIISDLPKPEWESKTVITEGVKNVQECLNPSGCPQDTKTGECLEGCTDQKVRIEMKETIIDPTNINVNNTTSIFDHDLILTALLEMDPYGEWRDIWGKYFGKPAWICVVSYKMGNRKFKTVLTRIIYSTPNLLNTCNNKVFPGESSRKLTPWTRPEIISNL